jgi:dienelactone hydrolase
MHCLDDRTTAGRRLRRFDIPRGGRRIPAALWTPTEDAGPPGALVLLGHGASGHKQADYVGNLARALVSLGMAAVAIDGPVHGDRRTDGGENSQLVFLEFCQAWSSDPAMTDDMVADWTAALDALQGVDDLAALRVGWWGVSMGTIIGLPFVAADPRISVAVLGLMGLTGPTRARIADDAPKIGCPVLFLVQWDDELFGRDSALELFTALGSADKRMHVYPGRHGALPQEAFRASEAFLAARLLDG